MGINKKERDSSGVRTITVIAEGVKIEGKIHSKGSTRIDGIVIGEIISERDFIVGKEGKVQANVKTNNAVIAGNFKGDMIASGEVEITPTGKFMGSLIQKDAALIVFKGGLFKGESTISENQDVFSFEPEKALGAPSENPARVLSHISPEENNPGQDEEISG